MWKAPGNCEGTVIESIGGSDSFCTIYLCRSSGSDSSKASDVQPLCKDRIPTRKYAREGFYSQQLYRRL